MSIPKPQTDSPEPKSNEGPWWKELVPFGDYHADTHEFLETAGQRAPKEIGCALAASLLVSPLVSIIDKCIVQEIGGTQQFMKAIGNATKEMIYTPKTFFGGLSFRMTAWVYFGTYAVANLSELALDTQKIRDDDRRKTLKVSAASVANISLLAWRDSVFAREFGGSKAPAAKTPMRTIGLFAARDASTMYATFYAAPRAAEYLQDKFSVERNVSELSMAIAVPVFTQVCTAPLHIHAMDYYNRPNASAADRLATIKKEFGTVSFARGLRILPAFGIGSFSNNKFRENFIRQPDENKLLTRRVTNYVEAKLGRRLSSR